MESIHIKDLEKKLQEKDTIHLVDVREQNEYENSHIEGAINLPLSKIKEQLNHLEKDKEYHIICVSGARSAQASSILELNGYKVKSVIGGMKDWEGKVISNT